MHPNIASSGAKDESCDLTNDSDAGWDELFSSSSVQPKPRALLTFITGASVIFKEVGSPLYRFGFI